MKEIFLEIIIAPDFTEDALAVLTEKKNLRLLRIPALNEPAKKRTICSASLRSRAAR